MKGHDLYRHQGGRTLEAAWLPARPATCSLERCTALAVEEEPRALCQAHRHQVEAVRAYVLSGRRRHQAPATP